MASRLRSLAALAVILTVGILAGSALAQWRGKGGDPRKVLPHPTQRVRVEVLNGGGRSGAARDATGVLRDLGYDVVFYGNAGEFGRDTSWVLDRVGRLPSARDVADALGIHNVRSEPDSNLYLDVSVVLGADWVPQPADSVAVADSLRRPWWDPRNWIPRAAR